MSAEITRDFILTVLREEENLYPGQWIELREASDPQTCRVCAIGSIVRRVISSDGSQKAYRDPKEYRERIQDVARLFAFDADGKTFRLPGEWNLSVQEIHRRASAVVANMPGISLSWVFESLGRSFDKEISELTPEDLNFIREHTVEFVREFFPEKVSLEI